MSATKVSCGECPKCKSTDLDYGDTLIADDSLGYKFVCLNCDTSGIEWYDIVYSETVADE